MKTLVILRGAPGSGKSTFAEWIASLSYDAVVCSADDFFYKGSEYKFDASKLKQAHMYCKQKCIDAMEEDCEHIFIANTNTTQREIQPYFDLAEKYGYRVFSIIVESRHNGENVHGVPEETIEKMKNRFEVML